VHRRREEDGELEVRKAFFNHIPPTLMSSFQSKDAYWQFAQTIRDERRFIFDGKAGEFLTAVRVGSKSREQSVKSGSRLFRAQVGTVFATNEDGYDEECPHPETRMVPDAKHIKNGGRANPPGFAYLYLANTKETALAELRPWVGESLTLGIFEMQKDIKLAVCRAGSENSGDLLFEENPTAEQIDKCVWNDISKAFARPVSRQDQESSYLPTQILAEAFKAEGFDGLAYQSGLERGTNIVLFNANVAKPVPRCRFVYTLKKVRYDFRGDYPHVMYDRKDGTGQGIYEISTESP
jgi:RES domain-containing protein